MHSKNYIDEYINENATNDTENFIQNCENNYHNQINKVVDSLIELDKKFLLISGPSSAGKTTTSNLIRNGIIAKNKHCRVISLDDFFLEREQTPLLPNGKKDYESVNSIDWQLFHNVTSELLKGNDVLMPTFNFVKGKKEYFDKTRLEEDEIIIIEGLHALNPMLENFLDSNKVAKLYLSVTSMIVDTEIEPIFNSKQIRLMRRMIRDSATRGKDLETTINTWKSVCEGELMYISPFKKLADFKIDTIHPYEVCVYADILSTMNLNDCNSKVAKEMYEKLKRFKRLSSSFVPKTSLIQEFIK